MRIIAISFTLWCIVAQTVGYERARELMISGRAAEAAAIYRELLLSDSGNPNLLLNLSIAEYKAGRFRQAAESAASALERAPDLLAARVFLGASYLQLGEFTKAVDSLERVIAADPGERNARLLLAQARAGLHDAALRWREASTEWSQALKLAPTDPKVRYSLAWSLFRGRDYDASISTLKPLLTDQASAEVHFLYGASLLNLGQPAEAMPPLRAALAANPDLLAARAAIGQALLQTGKPEEAIPFLKSSTSTDQDGSLHFQLFRAYQLTRRKAEAQQALASYHRLRASGARTQ